MPISSTTAQRNSARHLIVNADDFGLTEGINRGIIEGHERGIVTSASLMVRYPAAAEAAEYARAHPKLSVGLHFELGEWRYTAGEWQLAFKVADATNPEAVQAELERQFASFENLLGRNPTHLDSHQHVHNSEPVRALLVSCAEKRRVPLRSVTPGVAYTGSFYGQTAEGAPYPAGISLAQLIGTIESLPIGWTEMGSHPGYPAELDSVYRSEREEELCVLCSREIREAIEEHGISLASFHDFNSRRA